MNIFNVKLFSRWLHIIINMGKTLSWSVISWTTWIGWQLMSKWQWSLKLDLLTGFSEHLSIPSQSVDNSISRSMFILCSALEVNFAIIHVDHVIETFGPWGRTAIASRPVWRLPYVNYFGVGSTMVKTDSGVVSRTSITEWDIRLLRFGDLLFIRESLNSAVFRLSGKSTHTIDFRRKGCMKLNCHVASVWESRYSYVVEDSIKLCLWTRTN
jgi:hypothetical protein